MWSLSTEWLAISPAKELQAESLLHLSPDTAVSGLQFRRQNGQAVGLQQARFDSVVCVVVGVDP
ncbi:MAG: hypothetical protein ACFCU6_13690 [Balneolaceae bacterium]